MARATVPPVPHSAFDELWPLTLLPGATAREVLDLNGRWVRERSPQRSRLDHGTHLRASRRGRTGHDATLLLVAGTTAGAHDPSHPRPQRRLCRPPSP